MGAQSNDSVGSRRLCILSLTCFGFNQAADSNAQLLGLEEATFANCRYCCCSGGRKVIGLATKSSVGDSVFF
jgi:hypothetical protein